MEKAYQIVVLGATGFVGKLVMLHIVQTPQYAVSSFHALRLYDVGVDE